MEDWIDRKENIERMLDYHYQDEYKSIAEFFKTCSFEA